MKHILLFYRDQEYIWILILDANPVFSYFQLVALHSVLSHLLCNRVLLSSYLECHLSIELVFVCLVLVVSAVGMSAFSPISQNYTHLT